MNRIHHMKNPGGQAENRKVDLADIWGDEADGRDWWLENKRDDIAITLTGMLENRNISFSDLARLLDWKPSRVSRALSGRENLTINTIAEIVRAADYDFDLVARPRKAQRAFQPWEQDALLCDLFEGVLATDTFTPEMSAMFETAEQIARRAFRNPTREQFYSDMFVAGDAANDEHHHELLNILSA